MEVPSFAPFMLTPDNSKQEWAKGNDRDKISWANKQWNEWHERYNHVRWRVSNGEGCKVLEREKRVRKKWGMLEWEWVLSRFTLKVRRMVYYFLFSSSFHLISSFASHHLFHPPSVYLPSSSFLSSIFHFLQPSTLCSFHQLMAWCTFYVLQEHVSHDEEEKTEKKLYTVKKKGERCWERLPCRKCGSLILERTVLI